MSPSDTGYSLYDVRSIKNTFKGFASTNLVQFSRHLCFKNYLHFVDSIDQTLDIIDTRHSELDTRNSTLNTRHKTPIDTDTRH